MTNPNKKALVTVLEDVETAHAIVEKLHQEGFALDKVELVTHSVKEEAPQIETPYTSGTTTNTMLDESIKDAGLGAGIGLGAGLIAAVLTGFPGVGLGMIAMGGLVGGALGSIAGVDKAVEDDSIDLPKVKEYEQLVKDGRALVVVLGTHDEVHRASDLIEDMPSIYSHIHKLHGHEFHEHPSNED